MKADLAIYSSIPMCLVCLDSTKVALMLSHKMEFNCCAGRDGFRKSSHILCKELVGTPVNSNN